MDTSVFFFSLLPACEINPENCGRTRSVPAHQYDKKKFSHSIVAAAVGALDHWNSNRRCTLERRRGNECSQQSGLHPETDLTCTHGH